MELSQLSDADISLLRLRQLSAEDINAFQTILSDAKQSQMSAHQFLSALDNTELALVQKANALATPIAPQNLSKEGAANLFAMPTGKGLVDFNNDGLVEIGEAKSIRFPPVNAPEFVNLAWENATTGLDLFDKATLELTMHHMVYGIQLDGFPGKTPLPASQQWSLEGTSNLFGDLYSNLDFRVGMDGWTERNRQLKDVYQTFQTELETHFGEDIQPTRKGAANAAVTPATSEQSNGKERSTHLTELNQLLLDARIGLDREKLKEIEKKMEAVQNDPSLSPQEKTQKLQALQAEIERVIEEARRRAVEEEKRKSALNATERFGENSRELQVKKHIFEFL